MPADRDHHSASGPSQPNGLWPGQDIPHQQAAPDPGPWPDAGRPAPGVPSDAGHAEPWPTAGQPTQTIGTELRAGEPWPGAEQPPQPDGAAPPWPYAGYPTEVGGGGSWPPAAPVSAPPGGPRRRWRLVVAAAVTLAVAGGGAAVATMRGDSEPVSQQAGPVQESAAPSAAVTPGPATPSPTPSGAEGLGGRPASASPSPSATATADKVPGFTGTRLTLPGLSIDAQSGETFSQAMARSDRTFGRPKMARIFYPGLPPAWDGSRSDLVDRTVVVSFKASPQEINTGKYDSRLASWFASIPREHNVYWSYFHEPEDDVERGSYTAAAYRTAWRRIAGLADRADNPRLINTLILMCWTVDPKSGRNFNDFYPGGDVVEALGWDCYNWAVKWKRYASPQEVFGRMISKSRELGKPWGLAETGSDLLPGDSGMGRAGWIRSMTTYINGQRPEFVAYWNNAVSYGDFRLLDSPSIQAWRSFCTA